MTRPIAISLSPNTEKDDVVLAFKMLLSPLRWFDFRETERFENEFALLYGKKYKAIAVNSGRSAFYLILKALGVGAGDEVAIQALTCVAVPNSVLWLKSKPLYIDVDETFNMNPDDLERKLSKNTRAIVVQHTFGIPANMDKITKIAQKRNIPVIEDCALSLGASYKNKQVGTLGDIAFYSTGRDKVLSSVFGGIILSKEGKLYDKLLEDRDKLSYPGPRWLIQQLLHPLLFSLILPFYKLGYRKLTLGKIMLFIFQKIGFLSKAVYKEEELGKQPKIFPTKLPGALSVLAMNQLNKLEKFNYHRGLIASAYFQKLKNTNFKLPQQIKGAIWIRFPVIYDNAKTVINCAKIKGVLLGDWYSDVVVPVAHLSVAGYEIGSCPNAQKIAGKIINLPTYPTLNLKKANEVVRLIKLCQNLKH